MSKVGAHIALSVSLILASGCAIKPGSSAVLCNFRSYALEVEDPDPIGLASDHAVASATPPTLRAMIAGETTPVSVATATAGTTVPVSPDMLFLSGGSQNGAFGAGFLDQWGRMSAHGKLPAFGLVTGISTGAILATFAFVGDPASAVSGYSVQHESDLLHLFVKVKDGDPTKASYIQVLRKGALADLAPLRRLLHDHFPPAVLERVHAEGQRGRLLVVGVVDVDTGKARALDLTEMAQQFHAARTAGDAGTANVKRDCYIDAVVASSSAPMAALPVFIDNRMYVDGGARFGMFYLEEVGGLALRNARGAKTEMFLIVNGNQTLDGKCGKHDARRCEAGLDPPTNLDGAHKDWDFLALALRSEQILANQVYRFSAERIEAQAATADSHLHFVRIMADVGGFAPFDGTHHQPVPDPMLNDPTKSCGAWKQVDRETENPLQFYPRYMHCLIAYGRDVAQRDGWRWADQGAVR